MSPFPLAAGKRIAADDLNTILPDGMAWKTYTPTLRALTTNPTLGTGAVQVGRYYRLGRLAIVSARVQFGTSGVAAGSGEYRVSLPVDVANADEYWRLGRGTAYDASANVFHVIEASVWVGATGELGFLHDSGGVIGAGTPFAWAANDRLDFTALYEVA